VNIPIPSLVEMRLRRRLRYAELAFGDARVVEAAAREFAELPCPEARRLLLEALELFDERLRDCETAQWFPDELERVAGSAPRRKVPAEERVERRATLAAV